MLSSLCDYMNMLHNFPSGPEPPQTLYALIEAPAKGKNKYEYDFKREVFMLEKVIHSPFTYPVDFGFIPSTWYDDSAPLDVMLLVFEPTFPGCLVRCRPIGLLRIKHAGGLDDKVLAVPLEEPRLKDVNDISDVPIHTKKEIAHFFVEYRKLDGEWSEVMAWEGRKEAERAIEHAINLYKRKYGR